VAVDGLLDPAPALVERVTGQAALWAFGWLTTHSRRSWSG
jgi:hypothetical protein